MTITYEYCKKNFPSARKPTILKKLYPAFNDPEFSCKSG